MKKIVKVKCGTRGLCTVSQRLLDRVALINNHNGRGLARLHIDACKLCDKLAWRFIKAVGSDENFHFDFSVYELKGVE
ncbi:hypothetical protein PSNTI_00090 [Stutzerimonas stutzeri]|nr:hypothetical protein PSNTI_00090 [Stutzerimonas stutzeri]